MPESSNKGGRKPRVTDEDLLAVFRSTSDPVLSTAEVADAVPIKRRGTLNRLQGLEEDGGLESKQIGGRNTVWWFVDDPEGFAAGDLRGDPSTTLDDTDAGHTATTPGGTDATEPTARGIGNAESGRTHDESDAVDPVDHDELPDEVDVADARAAYDAVRSHLREQGPAGKRSIVAAVMVEYPLGYDTPDPDADGRYRGAWWRRVIRPALAADPDVTHRENHGDYDL